MLKTFTIEYIISNRGCYEKEQVEQLTKEKVEYTIQDILNWNIPIKDKFWFVRNKTELSTRQKQFLALECAKVSVKIYELKYPNDKRIAVGVIAIENYLNGVIDLNLFNNIRQDIRKAADA